MRLTFGSVCSGVEAASAAWHQLGWRPAWFSEIEPFPCTLLAYRFPNVPNLGDMTRLPGLIRSRAVAAPDVLCGGTPCQAFSIAGRRNSLDDARGNLSLTFCEIADEIDAQRAADGLVPATIFWENVPGVLSTKDNAFGCFLAGLAGEDDPLIPSGDKWTNAGCVFGPKRAVAWRVMDAQYTGVAQRRRRVFVVASAREGFDPAAVLFEFDGVRRDTAPSRQARQEITGTLSARTSGGGGLGTDFELGGGFQPYDPLIAQLAGEVICMAHGQGGAEIASGRSPTLTCNHEAPIAAYSVSLRGREGGNMAELGGEVAGTLRASQGGSDKPHVLAPIAFDSRQDTVSSTEVFGALGSSSPQAQAIAYAIQAGALRTNPSSGPDGIGVQEGVAYTLEARAEVQAVCVTGDVTHTLRAEGFDASEDGTGRGAPIVPALSREGDVILGTPQADSCMAVRRLTPRECERLQGFPDDWTLIPVKKVRPERLRSPRAGTQYAVIAGDVWQLAADGPRYKALGNSWAVPNVRWIGERIDRALQALEAA